MKKKIFGFASDHAGFAYKESLKQYVISQGFEVIDYGPSDMTNSSYAFYGKKLGQALQKSQVDYGIGVCGTGLGISYALNRFTKVRAARVSTIEDAHLSRQHNNANALAIGERTTSLENAKAMVDEFIKTAYEGGRHQSRIDELDEVTHCLQEKKKEI